MIAEPYMYKLGKLAARQASKSLNRDEENILLDAIFNESKAMHPADYVIPMTDFDIGYEDQMFKENPSTAERRMYADLFAKVRNAARIGLLQSKTSNDFSYKGPLVPRVD
jgi:hypothetical protein